MDGKHIFHQWVDEIPQDQWAVYRSVIQAAHAAGLRFALGGAFSVATYTGRWRNTKDLDFYVLPQDRQHMIETVHSTGMRDYYEKLPYDRSWIYRLYRADGLDNDSIVDVIWAMANQRAQVDEIWLTHGAEISVHGELLRVIPLEELVWAKLYILQPERCDWPDIFNLLFPAGPYLDWERLLARLGEDLPLLGALLTVFTWLSPSRAGQFPNWIWDRLQLPQPETDPSPQLMQSRASLLDTRPWFYPLINEDK